MSSQDLKDLAYSKRIAIWMIADRLGVHENTLLRWLRHDLPEEKQKQILKAINAIVLERTTN